MTKIDKGNVGYITAEKQKRIFRVLCAAVLIVAMLIAGYAINGTKMNLLTIVAILACLPFARLLVSLLILFPYHSITAERMNDILKRTDCLTMVFETIITSKEKVMPVDMIAISSHTVCAYTQYEKTDPEYAANYLKDILRRIGYDKISVKVLSDYTAFYTRAEGMNNMARIGQPDTKDQEEKIKKLILNHSL